MKTLKDVEFEVVEYLTQVGSPRGTREIAEELFRAYRTPTGRTIEAVLRLVSFGVLVRTSGRRVCLKGVNSFR